MVETYRIASKIWQIEFDNTNASEILKEQLCLYDKFRANNILPDIFIKINPLKRHTFIANNPKIHFETENGFMCVYKRIKVLWEKQKNKIYIEVFFNSQKNILTKWNNIQFHYPYQRFGQMFHELVIYPTILMFIDNVVVIHGSSVSNDDTGYVFTGSGGSGKTSISTSLVLEKNFKFIADDITFLSKDGFLHGNFEFPKIYHYNVKQNIGLKKKLMHKRNIFDKVQWVLKKKIPPYSVRRSVNPKDFFDNKIAKSAKLHEIYNLIRCNCKKVTLEKISKEKIAEMNLEIIKSEFSDVFKHLQWHRFNRIALGKESLISQKEITDKYSRIQKSALQNTDVFLLKIPLNKEISNYIDLDGIYF